MVNIIDLSVALDNESPSEPFPVKIFYSGHGEGYKAWRKRYGIEAVELTHTHGLGPAWEEISLNTHSGTHLDSPWHYHPVSEGKLAKTIDEVPLSWCYGDGVVLDLRHKNSGELITPSDIQEALDKIKYQLKPMDIVLLMTGSDKRYGHAEYFEQPGMGRESILSILDHGVKVIGIDAFAMDRSWKDQESSFKQTRDPQQIWPAHLAGMTKEYCHIEKLANLDKIPQPFGFKVAAFPVKISKASAGWVRAVAILD